MALERRKAGLGAWEIAGLGLFAFGVGVAGVLSWRWAKQGPPTGPRMHPGGWVPPATPATPGSSLPPAGPKSGGYDPSEGPVPDSSDWTQPPLSGPGYIVRRPSRTWGTKPAVASVVGALGRYAERRDELGLLNDELDPLNAYLGDMSKKGGGPMPPHVSHKRGRDIDISFRKRGVESDWLPMPALALLVYAFLQDDNVTAIYLDTDKQREVWEALEMNPELAPGLQQELQYPLAPHSGRTRVRHWPGHSNHIHVRFRE